MSDIQVSLTAGDPFAGFWRRFGAWVIDHILISICFRLVALYVWQDLLVELTIQMPDGAEAIPFRVPSLLGLLVLVVWTCAYVALQESSRVQATVGKRAFGIKVCDYNGDRISLLTASYRAWPHWLPGLINMILILSLIVAVASLLACLAVAFTKRKQGLHDIMARCLVVKRRAVFSDAPRNQT